MTVLQGNRKWSELGAASTLDGTEISSVVQDGVNVQTTVQDIAGLVRKSTSDYAGATLRAKVEAFIAEANAGGGNMELNFDHIVGSSLDLSSGGPLTEITGRNTWFNGHGHLLIMNPTGFTFRYGNGTNFCSGGCVKNFEFYYDPADNPNSAAVAISANYVSFLEIRNIVMTGGAGIFNGTCTNSKTNGFIQISHIRGAVDDLADSAVVDRGHSVALQFLDSHVSNRYDAGANTVASERNGIIDTQSTAGSYSSLIIDNVFMERYYTGLKISAGASVFNIDYFINNSTFDGCYKHGLWMFVDGSGIISNIQMNNSWFNAVISAGIAASYGAYIQGTGTGRIGLMDMAKCFITGGKTADMTIVGRVSDINITGLRAYTYETPAALKAGVLIDNTAGVMRNISITGSQIEVDSPLVGFNADFGVYINGTEPIPGLLIENNLIGGDSVQLVLPTYVANNSAALVANNRYKGIGTQPGGYKAAGVYAIPASTVAWVNFQPQRTMISLYGGTVTAVKITDITGSQQTISNNTPVSFVLEPGENFSVTYSVVPTALFKVLE